MDERRALLLLGVRDSDDAEGEDMTGVVEELDSFEYGEWDEREEW